MPAAKIDFVSKQADRRVDIAGGLLPLQFAADIPDIRKRNSNAGQDHRTDRCPLRNVVGAEDRSVGCINVLSGFGPTPVEDADADADIRLDASVAHGQEANGSRDRDHAELQFLFNLGAVGILEVAIDARGSALVVPEADASLQIVAEREEPLAAD